MAEEQARDLKETDRAEPYRQDGYIRFMVLLGRLLLVTAPVTILVSFLGPLLRAWSWPWSVGVQIAVVAVLLLALSPRPESDSARVRVVYRVARGLSFGLVLLIWGLLLWAILLLLSLHSA